MSLLTPQVAFYYMAIASVASALLAVTRRNPVHSMLWVLSLFMHVAGIFLLLNAEFLADHLQYGKQTEAFGNHLLGNSIVA